MLIELTQKVHLLVYVSLATMETGTTAPVSFFLEYMYISSIVNVQCDIEGFGTFVHYFQSACNHIPSTVHGPYKVRPQTNNQKLRCNHFFIGQPL